MNAINLPKNGIHERIHPTNINGLILGFIGEAGPSYVPKGIVGNVCEIIVPHHTDYLAQITTMPCGTYKGPVSLFESP